MREHFLWLTCPGTDEDLQVKAMEDFFDDVCEYYETLIELDDYSDIIAISIGLSEKNIKEDEDLLLAIYEATEDVEVVDTVEIEEIDCHIYRVDKVIKGELYHIFHAMDVNS